MLLCVLQVAVAEAMAAAVMDTKLEAFETNLYLTRPQMHAQCVVVINAP